MKKNKKSNDLYESQLVKKILNSVLPIIENKLTEPYGISSGTYDDLYDQEVKNKKNADWALKRKENSRNRFKYNGHYERNPLYDETKPWNKEDYVLDTDDNGNYIPKEFNEDNDIISFYTFKDDKGNDTNR
jgi:hypothetical protein